MKGLVTRERRRTHAGLLFRGGMLHAGTRQSPATHPTDALLSHALEDRWARVIGMCHFPRVTQTLTN